MNALETFFSMSPACRTLVRDKARSTLAHSYMIVCRDTRSLRGYVKAAAKAIMCEKGDLNGLPFCGECRACRLIEKNSYGDFELYPKEGGKVTAEDVDIMVSESCFVRPLEASCRVFGLTEAEKINIPSQNKMLKTLEEPPENVYIILATSVEQAILRTVRSRVRRLEIPAFTPEEIYKVLKGDYRDMTRLNAACEMCDGCPGEVPDLYLSNEAVLLSSECIDILDNMKKSRQIAKFSKRLIKKTRPEFAAFLNSFRVVIRDVLLVQEGRSCDVVNRSRMAGLNRAADKFKEGALITFTKVLDDAIAAFSNNANQTMIADGVLFALLEENYRWQRL